MYAHQGRDDWQVRRYLQRESRLHNPHGGSRATFWQSERREQACALHDQIWLETRKHTCHARHIQTIGSLARDPTVRAQPEQLSPLRRHFPAADEFQVRR